MPGTGAGKNKSMLEAWNNSMNGNGVLSPKYIPTPTMKKLVKGPELEENGIYIWGCKLEKGRAEYEWKYPNSDDDAPNAFHQLELTQAALGRCDNMEEAHIIEIEATGWKNKIQRQIIAHLKADTNPMCNFTNLVFDANFKLRLIAGSGPVTITGMHTINCIDDDEYEEEEEEEEEEDDSEEEDEVTDEDIDKLKEDAKDMDSGDDDDDDSMSPGMDQKAETDKVKQDIKDKGQLMKAKATKSEEKSIKTDTDMKSATPDVEVKENDDIILGTAVEKPKAVRGKKRKASDDAPKGAGAAATTAEAGKKGAKGKKGKISAEAVAGPVESGVENAAGNAQGDEENNSAAMEKKGVKGKKRKVSTPEAGKKKK